ncbi:helix-turn-helix domain-containing protein [Paenibacillus sp. XY044]|uniref:AraC family transcriptional regulator n=1 Tax=Paenibacillus sp. XY044 TaxID=2026089 RepID=UPI000B9996C2|nr:helix-turn-helix domain-containing protein [Paenibacillus sp. XY044]OZB96053.1 hypothetical protein CJP46_09005 [Paenibacillus sp. XY044]
MNILAASTAFEMFLPVQPGFAKHFTDYTEHRDVSPDTPLPVLFYQFSVPSGHSGRCPVLPGGHVDFLFPAGGSPSDSFILGSVLCRREVPFRPGTLYFGVRLLPVSLAPTLNIPLKELPDRSTPLTRALSIPPCWAQQIQAEGASFHRRISAFHSGLRQLLHSAARSAASAPQNFYRAIRLIFHSHGNISIAELSAAMSCSTRSFRSLFETYIGLSPKLFCQIIRYQSAVGRLLHPSRTAFNDIISEYGYYDQAHFIHEFKKFSCECPTRWMVQLLRKS